MNNPLIISVSGLRGVVGEALTPEVAMRYACACAESVGEEGPFVITRDGRRSGEMLANILHAALNATGRDTIDGGIAATPTTGILIAKHRAAGGFQISASHNPSPFNGIKFFSHQGRIVPKAFGETILARYKDANWTPRWVDVEHLGTRLILDEFAADYHLEKILPTVEVEAIRKAHFRVLLDSNHGAGSLLGRKLLQKLGCEVILRGETPDGLFEHIPEPVEENLSSIFDAVRKEKVDIGFCQDPDADRLAVIDAAGNYPGEEYTVALCAWNRLEILESKRGQIMAGGPLVINCSSSRMTMELAKRYHRDCFCSPVGEANVVDLMLENEAAFGGEGNGGPIDPVVGLVRDSLVGMANILDLMARHQAPLSELVKEIPKYYIVKRKRTCKLDEVSSVLARLEKAFSGEELNRQDGLRIDRAGSWCLIRGSNTEPIIRVIAEAESQQAANDFCDEVENTIAEQVVREAEKTPV